MKLPSDLTEAYEDSALIVCVGSRLSTSSGLPSLQDLALGLIECVEEWASDDEPDQLRSWIEKRRTSEVLDQLKRHLGPEFEVEVERRLTDNGREVPAIARSLASLRKKLRAVYTMRLDRLIERAFAGRWPSFSTPRADFAQRRRIIFKLRGTLEFVQSWVLTAEQEERELLGRSPRRAMLETAYEAHRLLFIGFDPDDEELDLLLKAARAGQGEETPEHFIVLPSISRKERTTLERRGLSVIRGDTEDVLEALGAVEEGEDSLLSGGCPYPGLDVFTEDMASVFFGRHAEVSQATALLGGDSEDHKHWLSVEGQAGVGKSSFILAGLLPALRNGFATGLPDRWVVATMRPGSNPVDTLAQRVSEAIGPLNAEKLASDMVASPDALAQLITKKVPKEHGFLLVIDQFEELVAFAPPQQRALFGELIYRALELKALYLITSMRSDFAPTLQDKLPAFASLLNEDAVRYVLPPISRVGLREAITEPAALRAVMIEPALIERIVRDAEGDDSTDRGASASALPLVAHALRGLWHASTSRGSILGVNEYEELGGVIGALGRSADRILSNLDAVDLAAAKAMLLQMVRVERDGTIGRRRVARDQLVDIAGKSTEDKARKGVIRRKHKAAKGEAEADQKQVTERGTRVLLALSGGAAERAAGVPSARLLTVLSTEGQTQVELVHESLAQDWKTLRGWIDENRRQLLLNDELERRAEKWQELGKPSKGLPRSQELAELLEGQPLGETAALQEEYQEALDRANVRRWAAGIGLGTLGVATLTGGVIFFAVLANNLDAEKTKLEETYAKLEVAKQSADDSNEKLRAQEEVLRTQKDQLQIQANKTAGIAATMLANENGRRREAIAMALNAYAGSLAGASIPADVANGVFVTTQELHPLHELGGHAGAIYDIAFSPRGVMATSSFDQTVKLWTTETLEPGPTLSGHGARITSVQFSSNGKLILTRDENFVIKLWQDSGEHAYDVEAEYDVTAVAISSRDIVATAGSDGELSLWKPEISSISSFHDDSVDTLQIDQLQFTPDGALLIAGSHSGAAHIFDVEAQKLVGTVTNAGKIEDLALSADGSKAATGAGNLVKIWNTRTGAVAHTLEGPQAWVRRVAFAPDDPRLVVVYTGRDTAPILWDTDTGTRVANLEGHTNSVLDAAFSPSRAQLATASDDGSLRLWDGMSGAPKTVLETSGNLYRVVYSIDGSQIATGDISGTSPKVRVWEARSTTNDVLAHAAGASTLYVSLVADGSLVALNEDNARVSVWNGETAERLEGVSLPPGVVALSPDGSALAIGAATGAIEIFATESGESKSKSSEHSHPIRSLAVAADNATIASGDEAGVVILHAKSGPVELEMSDETARGQIMGIDFADDGTITAANSRGFYWIWDSAGKLIKEDTLRQNPSALALSADGQRLVVATTEKQIWLLDGQGNQVGTIAFDRQITAMAISPDASEVALGVGPDVIRLNLSSGERVAVGRHAATVRAVRFAEDGQSILSAAEDGVAKRWNGSVQARAALACEGLRQTADYASVAAHCESIRASQ